MTYGICPKCGGNLLRDNEDGIKCLQCCYVPAAPVHLPQPTNDHDNRTYGRDYKYAAGHTEPPRIRGATARYYKRRRR